MDTHNVGFFKLASSRLNWLAERQKVVSGNIANADTAGFKTRDVTAFGSYLESNVREHFNAPVETQKVDGSWHSNLSGNNVVLEEQMVLAAETADHYKIATSLYKKAHQLILAATSGR